MERKFEQELEELKQNLLSLATRVERNISDAIASLGNHDAALAEDVISRDPLIDVAEIHVDELCLFILARRQPVARDLRFVTTALKIVKDLERIGDMASDISEHVLALLQFGPVRPFPDLVEMADSAQGMLKMALDAFVSQDPRMAREVIAKDDHVDLLHAKIWDELVALVTEDCKSAPAVAHLLSIAKYLERIGDHSSNVSEMVVFLAEGKDIRHFEKIRAFRSTEKQS